MGTIKTSVSQDDFESQVRICKLYLVSGDKEELLGQPVVCSAQV